MVDALPFTHGGDTASSSSHAFDAYPSCDSGQDESGPEVVYRLELTQPAPIRAMVLDGSGVDVDLQLLDDSGTPAGGIERDDADCQ